MNYWAWLFLYKILYTMGMKRKSSICIFCMFVAILSKRFL